MRELRREQTLKLEELKVETRYYRTKGLIEMYENKDEIDMKDRDHREIRDKQDKKDKTIENTKVIKNKSNSKIENLLDNRLKLDLNEKEINSNENQDKIQINLKKQNEIEEKIKKLQIKSENQLNEKRFNKIRNSEIAKPTWLDRLVDVLIGDDSRNQKYALICGQCFFHNGLALPEEFISISK